MTNVLISVLNLSCGKLIPILNPVETELYLTLIIHIYEITLNISPRLLRVKFTLSQLVDKRNPQPNRKNHACGMQFLVVYQPNWTGEVSWIPRNDQHPD